MKKILINKEGYVASPYIKDATIEIEVSDQQYQELFCIPFNHAWHYVNGNFILEDLLDDNSLRDRRNRECFRILDNRSPLWYQHLTTEQITELNNWYQEWLTVTETKKIPVKPIWLK